ncbi:MAG: endonuclease VIII [Woeseiaceae bacterium]|nr:endonuclease VIII [Woeseiaceae bacterium]
MPEGPEICRAADRVASVIQDKAIERVRFGLPSLTRYEKQLTDRIVTRVSTRGKAMLTRFDNDLTIYSHNQLYGRWYTMKRPRMPRTSRQLRLELRTDTHSALLYSASDIEVLDDEQLERHRFLSRLGPDLLDSKLTATGIAERLRYPQFRNRALGSLYLDQRFLAGNGNYLRSEILWVAALNPRTKPSSLSDQQVDRLARETLRIVRRSYRTRGVTVAPDLAKSLKLGGLGYERYRFYVFDREGLECHRCGSIIERHTMGSRNVFLCPGCQ